MPDEKLKIETGGDLTITDRIKYHAQQIQQNTMSYILVAFVVAAFVFVLTEMIDLGKIVYETKGEVSSNDQVIEELLNDRGEAYSSLLEQIRILQEENESLRQEVNTR